MMFLIFLLLFIIAGLYILSVWVKDSCKKDDNNHIDTEACFTNKLEKLLKNVTTEEQVLYKRIFDTIVYTFPDNYIIVTGDTYDSFNVNDITMVQIKNICVYINKVTKPISFCTDGTAFDRKLAKYECVGFDILDPKTNKPLNLNIPEEQFPIFDLLVNFIIWKIEIYYDKLLKDEKKKESEEHQAGVRKALKIVKPVR